MCVAAGRECGGLQAASARARAPVWRPACRPATPRGTFASMWSLMRLPVSMRTAALLLLASGCSGRAPVDLSGFEITLEHAQRPGLRASYSLSVHGDGTVRYEGVAWVKTMGERTWQIPTARVE